ncbi:acyltransferase family protein [Candidatus Desantisbacteria bacterium]|nr:acyltransferase family protein [Candidatus Desantisbacteria bacterium]
MNNIKKDQKFLYVDNLRVFLIILIIMLHIAITYGASGRWYYYEHTENLLSVVLLTVFCAVVQSFSLGFFFMIAGFFTPGPYSRKGAKDYMKGRIKRLGIPFLFYCFLINPAILHILFVVLKKKSITFWNYFGSVRYGL